MVKISYKGNRWKRQKELLKRLEGREIKPSPLVADVELASEEFAELFRTPLYEGVTVDTDININ